MKKLFLGLVLVSQVYCADEATKKDKAETDYAGLFRSFKDMGIANSCKKPGTKFANSAALGVKKSAPGSIGKNLKQRTIKHYFKNKKERNAESAAKKAAELEEVLRFDLMNLDDE